jgi:hypothetical protein
MFFANSVSSFGQNVLRVARPTVCELSIEKVTVRGRQGLLGQALHDRYIHPQWRMFLLCVCARHDEGLPELRYNGGNRTRLPCRHGGYVTA